MELTGARYGALGVIDRRGTGLEQFITVGIDAETQRADRRAPSRTGHSRRADPRPGVSAARRSREDPAFGRFPARPSADGLVSRRPDHARGAAFGNLYLTEKAGGEEFSDEDEEVVRLLAAQAAVAIENARLYESATVVAPARVAERGLGGPLRARPICPQLFELAATRLRELLDARVVMIQLPTLGWARAESRRPTARTPSGCSASGSSGSGRRAAGRSQRSAPERIDSLLDDPEVDQTAPRLVEASSALYVPLLVRDRAVGVIVAYDKRGADHRFSDADMRIALAFANRAALALDLRSASAARRCARW